MQGELVLTATADGLTLHGLLVAPPAPRLAVLAVHDLYGAFYTLPYLADLAQRLVDADAALLAVNTRDHDGVLSPPPAPDLAEAARLDLDAWLGFLQARGVARVVLLGHGLGACKVTGYVTADAEPRLAGVALVSPPDHAALVQRLGQRLDEALAWALLMLEAGQADELIRLEGIGPLSARAIRDLFGLRGLVNRFDYADRAHDWGWLAGLRLPLLLLHTDTDALSRPAADCLALVERHAAGAPSVATALVAADGVALAVADWVRGLA